MSWEAIEQAWDDRLEARSLFEAAKIAHEHARNEMMRAERELLVARERVAAALAHGERAGQLLLDAIRLMEARGA